MTESPRVTFIELKSNKRSMSPDSFQNRPGERTRARSHFDHSVRGLQSETSNHRFGQSGRARTQCSDAGRFSNKSLKKMNMIGEIESRLLDAINAPIRVEFL